MSDVSADNEVRIAELEAALASERQKRAQLIVVYKALREGFPSDPLEDFFDHEHEVIVVDENPWVDYGQCVKPHTTAYLRAMFESRSEPDRLKRAQLQIAAYRTMQAGIANCPLP